MMISFGEAVLIAEGPFAGYEAIFDQRLSGEECAQVLLEWMGHQRNLKVKMSNLRKANGTKHRT